MRKLVALAMIFALTGCANSQNISSYTIAQKDVAAVSIDAPANFSAERVVVLANGVAEIMNSLNATSIIVGRDVASTEAALEDIPVVTSGHQVLPEIVIGLKPDLVIIDASTGPKAAIDQIKLAGIKIVQTPEIWKVGDIGIKVWIYKGEVFDKEKDGKGELIAA
jgi:iron complex transport system substrate-binding protein